MRFSIIIPVYNVEKYIRKCLDSVMNQTFDDFEVIVVDDETPDNSMEIVQEIARQYPGKIRTVRQKNTRQGGARNRGVGMAQGEYILFVDSDDYVSPDLLKTVDARLRETPCDVLVFRFAVVTETGQRLTVSGFGDLKPGIYAPMPHKELLSLSSSPWNKAYRRSFYVDSQMAFPEKILYEDGMTRLLYAKASEIRLCEDCLYYYVQSANSSIRQKPSERMLDILKMNDLVTEAFRKAGIYDAYREYLECSLIKGVIYVLDIINELEVDSPLQVTLVDYVREHFPNYRENPYMDRELLNKMRRLESGQFRRYHWENFTLRKIKDYLLRSRVLSALNRRRLQHRDGRQSA